MLSFHSIYGALSSSENICLLVCAPHPIPQVSGWFFFCFSFFFSESSYFLQPIPFHFRNSMTVWSQRQWRQEDGGGSRNSTGRAMTSRKDQGTPQYWSVRILVGSAWKTIQELIIQCLEPPHNPEDVQCKPKTQRERTDLGIRTKGATPTNSMQMWSKMQIPPSEKVGCNFHGGDGDH